LAQGANARPGIENDNLAVAPELDARRIAPVTNRVRAWNGDRSSNTPKPDERWLGLVVRLAWRLPGRRLRRRHAVHQGQQTRKLDGLRQKLVRSGLQRAPPSVCKAPARHGDDE